MREAAPPRRAAGEQLALRVTAVYLFIGGVWVVVANSVHGGLFGALEEADAARWQMLKDGFFLFVMAGMLFLLVRHGARRLVREPPLPPAEDLPSVRTRPDVRSVGQALASIVKFAGLGLARTDSDNPVHHELQLILDTATGAQALSDPGTTGTAEASSPLAAGPVESVSAPRPDLRGLRVLVVDDDAQIRDVARRLLTVSGAVVSEAPDGRDALTLIDRGGIDLVLLDLVMPGMDGIETLTDLRDRHPGIYVVAMSGAAGGSSLVRAARKLGASADIAKPFSADELLAVVAAHSLVEGGADDEFAEARS